MSIVIDGGPSYELIISPQAPTAIDLAAPGPQGPPGPPGPAGGQTYLYDRAGIPASTWTISHNLGRYPHVSVLGDDGAEVDSDVVHSDQNNTVITFAAPFSGRAIIG